MKKLCYLVILFLFCLGCADLKSGLKEMYLYNTMSEKEWNEYQEKQASEENARKKKKKIQTSYKQTCEIFQGNKKVNTQKAYSQFMSELAQKLNSEGNGVNGTINANMPFHEIAYTSLGEQIKQLNTFLPYFKGFEQEECYKNLVQQVKAMQNMQDTVCRKAWAYEENQFKQQTGLTLPTTRESIFVANPKKGILYLVRGKILQNVKGGILISENEKIRFLYTNYTYPDDEYITGFATYAGMFQYTTTLGSSKTVYAFKQIVNTKYDSLYGSLQFYPTSTEKICIPRRQPTFAEIQKAFKSPSQTFIEQWGTKEASYKEDLSIGEEDIRFLQDVSTSQKNLSYAPNEVGKISRNKGILSTLNTLFLE